MKLRILFCLLLVFNFIGNHAYAFLTTAKVTVRVIDEDGQPMEGVNVGVGFSFNTGEGSNVKGQKGSTNADGKFTSTGSGNGHITYGADKEGHYHSYYAYDFENLGSLGWEPHNPELTVVLRKIENQIPMYARNTDKSRIEIPETDKEIGFDLIKFDWVAPYGSGVHGDFIFNLRKKQPNLREYSYELSLKFANISDGILPIEEDLQYGSLFKLPSEAPMTGYRSSMDFFAIKTKDYIRWSKKDNRNYIFRIRTTNDKDGNVQGMYGKIIGDINIGTKVEGTAYIKFKYYLNPEGSRNLEYDPSRNLFGKLPHRERVGIK